MARIEFAPDRPPLAGLACPACGNPACGDPVYGPAGFAAALTVTDAKAQDWILYRCGRCQSLFYHPLPRPDYAGHTSELQLRGYVEIGAAIDGPLENILAVVPEGSHGRMLDIGCGFGFALDAVRAVTGWRVKGFEPSQYGAEGRDQLGLDIVNRMAPWNPDPGHCYDIVHCSEVIEHVHDARAFVDILVSYLAPAGILVLTTPNPEWIVPECGRAELLALLSPGFHTILFSEQALVDLFRDAGLCHIRVDKSAKSTLLYASRRQVVLQHGQFGKAGLAYLESALPRAKPGSPLEVGLRYRLLRAAADAGRYDLARRTFVPGLADPDPRLDDIHSLAAFAARWPFCIAASTYCRGMILLNHESDFAAAARHFAAAHRLCRARLALAPSTAQVETDLVWRATYHKALAETYAGLTRHAGETLSTFDDGGLHPPVPEDLRPAIDALRRQAAGAAQEEVPTPLSSRPLSPRPLGPRSWNDDSVSEATGATPGIAAILPLHNGRDFVARSVSSMLDQTLPPDEIVVVDDGSTDGGAAVALEAAAGDPRVRIITKPNGGQSSARNLGVSSTRSPLIAFLDQDDWWYPVHLEVLSAPFRDPRYPPLGWVYSDLDEYDLQGRLLVRQLLRQMGGDHPKRDVAACIRADMHVLPSASLIAREAFCAVGGFDERLCGYEDDDLFLRIFLAGYDNAFVAQALSAWRIHSGSASYSLRMAQSRTIYARKLMEGFPDDRDRARYFVRDAIAPRFARAALSLYARSVRESDLEGFALALVQLDIVRRSLPPRRRWVLSALRPLLGSYPLAKLASATGASLAAARLLGVK